MCSKHSAVKADTSTNSKRLYIICCLWLLLIFWFYSCSPVFAQTEVAFWVMLGGKDKPSPPDLYKKYVDHRFDEEFITSKDKPTVQFQKAILTVIDNFDSRYNKGRKPEDQVRIRIQFISWLQAEKALNWAVDHPKDRPDLVQMPSTWTAYYASEGLLFPIDDIAQEAGAYVRYPRAILESCRIDGKEYGLYALPWTLDCRVYYYRKDDFQSAGFNDLSTREAFSRVSRLRDACEKVKAKTGSERDVLGITTSGTDWTIIHDLAPWIWRRGGAYVQKGPHGWRSGLMDTATREGLWDYIRFAMQFASLPAKPEEAQIGADMDDGFWHSDRQEYSLISTGQWVISRILRLPQEQMECYGTMAPLFSDRGSPVTYIGGSNLSLIDKRPQSNRSHAAQALLKYLATEEDTQVLLADLSGGIPSLRDALSRQAETKPLYNPVLEAIEFNQKEYYPSIPEWKAIEIVLKRTLGEIWVEAGRAKANNPGKIEIALEAARPGIDRALTRGNHDIEVLLNGGGIIGELRVFWHDRGRWIIIGLLLILLACTISRIRRRLMRYLKPGFKGASPCEVTITGPSDVGQKPCYTMSVGRTVDHPFAGFSAPLRLDVEGLVKSFEGQPGLSTDRFTEKRARISSALRAPAGVQAEIRQAKKDKRPIQLRVEDGQLPWHWISLEYEEQIVPLCDIMPVGVELFTGQTTPPRQRKIDRPVKVLAVYDEGGVLDGDPHTKLLLRDPRVVFASLPRTKSNVASALQFLKRALWFGGRSRRVKPTAYIREYPCGAEMLSKTSPDGKNGLDYLKDEIINGCNSVVSLHTHFEMVPENPNASRLYFFRGLEKGEDSVVISSQEFLEWLKHAQPSPRLVVLNACDSARLGGQDAKRWQPSLSFGQEILRQTNVEAVVATMWPVTNQTDISSFGKAFYKSLLLKGESYAQAVWDGVNTMHREHPADRRQSWAAYVLLGRADGCLCEEAVDKEETRRG